MAGEQWQQIGANLSAITSGDSGSAGGSSGHFAYDSEHLRGIVDAWNSLASNYFASISVAQNMKQVTGPGRDYASTGHAITANASGDSYVQSLQESQSYCEGQADKYRRAMKEIFGIDYDAASSLAKKDDNSDGGI